MKPVAVGPDCAPAVGAAAASAAASAATAHDAGSLRRAERTMADGDVTMNRGSTLQR